MLKELVSQVSVKSVIKKEKIAMLMLLGDPKNVLKTVKTVKMVHVM